MSDEKQIDELAKEICCICRVRTNCANTSPCTMAFAEAEGLFRDSGYRKQAWISVEDALPEREGEYLTCTCRGYMKLSMFCEWIIGQEPSFDDYTITHWMPLPDPPKTKGGAE